MGLARLQATFRGDLIDRDAAAARRRRRRRRARD
jgi:hypothetical protein